MRVRKVSIGFLTDLWVWKANRLQFWMNWERQEFWMSWEGQEVFLSTTGLPSSSEELLKSSKDLYFFKVRLLWSCSF